jgi:hypothetical protein
MKRGGKKPGARKTSDSIKLDFEFGELFVVLLFLVSIIAGSMYLSSEQLHEIPQEERSIRGIIDSGLAEAEQSFLEETAEGDFDVTTYRWYIGKGDDVPDVVPLGQEKRLASELLFNDGYMKSVRGIGFRVYEPTALATRTRIKCFGVFLNESTKMDGWLREGTEFTFDYFPYPMDRRVMENCHVTRSGMYRTSNDTIFRTYHWDCQYMWQGSRPSTINTFGGN